jgi:hypothetical protein
MTWYTLRHDSIEAFKASWPCHGLPDNLHSISCEFASNGDLVGIEAYGDDESLLDSADFDGPALAALTQDCREHGDITES